MGDVLHDLSHESRQASVLAAKLRELCGEDEQTFLDTLDGETDAVEAARRVLRWMREQEAQEAAVKGLADTYAARSKVFAERQERARVALVRFMGELGFKTLQLPEATLTVKAGGLKLIGDADAATLPDNLVRVRREPDKTAIKAALEAGREVSGYSLSNGEPSLQVRVR